MNKKRENAKRENTQTQTRIQTAPQRFFYLFLNTVYFAKN